jgi:hypothetical protein
LNRGEREEDEYLDQHVDLDLWEGIHEAGDKNIGL